MKILKTTATLIITATALTLTACASMSPSNDKVVDDDSTNHQNQPMQVTYQCDDNGQVAADYSPDGSRVKLMVTMPSIKLTNRAVTLVEAVSASGARYINDVNPKTSYEWHNKGQEGLLTVVASNGKAYTMSCGE